MTNDETQLRDMVHRLEQAWNNSNSIAWAAEFAPDADFIHVLGGFYHGAEAIEQGHRTIFDTIYKNSHNRFEVDKVRSLGPDAAIVFTKASLKWYLKGQEQNLEARPTLVAQKNAAGDWKIVTFQNTLITQAAAPAIANSLATAHPFPGQ